MERRTHWLFPVISRDPERLILACRAAGVGGARAASSVTVVHAPPGRAGSRACCPALLDEADRDTDPDVVTHLARTYGRDSLTVMRQRRLHRDALERIHPDGPDVWGQVYHAVEREWATTVDDVIRRRTTLTVRGLASPTVRADVGRILAWSSGSNGRAPAPRPALHLVRPPVQ